MWKNEKNTFTEKIFRQINSLKLNTKICNLTRFFLKWNETRMKNSNFVFRETKWQIIICWFHEKKSTYVQEKKKLISTLVCLLTYFWKLVMYCLDSVHIWIIYVPIQSFWNFCEISQLNTSAYYLLARSYIPCGHILQ